jgi:hypothetical protein
MVRHDVGKHGLQHGQISLIKLIFLQLTGNAADSWRTGALTGRATATKGRH